MSVFYWVVKAILGPVLRVVFRPWADGTDNVPREGPAIIASNHLSFSDHFFAPLPLPRQVVFLAKSEYFTGRGLKGLVSKAFIGGVGGIPVDRSGGEASDRALRTGLRVLANGHVLGIYPEGTRTPDGRLYRGKTGVARLALEARAPVIPCAMVDTFELLPPGKVVPRLRIRPGVRFGTPLDFSRYYGLESDRIVLRAITDEIMYAIMKLSGQEYVDTYARRTKIRLPAVGRGHGHGVGHSQDGGDDRGHGADRDHGDDRDHGHGDGDDRDHGQDGGDDRGHGADRDHGDDRDHGHGDGDDRDHGHGDGDDRDHGHGDGEDLGPVLDLGFSPDPDAGLVPEPAADLGPGPEAMVQADHAPGDRAGEPDEVAASD